MSRLDGLRVWVTRPAHQADALCAAIEAAGGHALRQPLLTIEDPADREAARRRLRAAETADDLIFTSRNAVTWAWRLVPGFAPAGRLAAVGRATATALAEAAGREVATPEDDFSSEGLLAMPDFAHPDGRSITVVTGEGGRDAIPRALAERGAAVAEAAVYRRRPARIGRARLEALLAEADAIVITSGEALSHLVAITPEALQPALRARQLVVPSSRV